MRQLDARTVRIAEARRRLLQTWLAWGVAPLALLTIVAIFIAAGPGAEAGRSARASELGFQGVFAVSAALFLIGFYLDGRWTDARRVAARLHASATEGGASPSSGRRQERSQQAELIARAPIAFESVFNSAAALAGIGIAMALTGLLGAIAGLGMKYTLVLMVLAAEYQIFVVSRVPYYLEILEAALRGELAPHSSSNRHGE